MKRILLTSTALVMVAGIAAADGHSSISWSGSATAGLARIGTPEAVAATTRTASSLADSVKAIAGTLAAAGANNIGTDANYLTMVLANVLKEATATKVLIDSHGGTAVATLNAGTTAALAGANIVLQTTAATKANMPTATDAEIATIAASLANQANVLYATYGKAATTKATAGEFETYSEVNATVTGNVTAGSMTLSASVSLDAGRGYDFADDDGWDGAKGTASVGLDSVSLDMGSAGKVTFDDNNTTHLVDADDNDTGDVKYTNTFGGASLALVLDVNTKDTDDAFVAGVAATTVSGRSTLAGTAGDTVHTAATASTAQDVQWSGSISMPLGGGSVYAALDEEGGNKFGGSAVMGGMTLGLDSKLEALDKEEKKSRSNTLSIAMPMGAMAFSASYNTIKDGDQWGIGASYASGDMSVAVSTDEGSDWSANATYALGTDASVVGGINYTEDAYLGLSFAF